MFAVAAASSNVEYLNLPIGRALRWWMLAELAAIAVLYAAVRRGRPRGLGTIALLAGVLGALALVSTAWSTAPRVTLERGASFAVLLVAAGALAYAAAGRERAIGQLLLAVLAGSTLVALLGLVHLWFSSEQAVIPATSTQPARYNGLGANPNTMALLLALATPLAVWAVWEVRSRRGRGVALAALALLGASIVASGARGALFAAAIGVFVFAAFATSRPRMVAIAFGATAAFTLLSVVVFATLPTAEHDTLVPTEVHVKGPPEGAERVLPLRDEIGFPAPDEQEPGRTLFTSGGRARAWKGALGQVAERPVVGYGFGTEELAFVDRYHLFFATRVENTYIGTALQLGAVGFVALLAVLGAVLWHGRRVRKLAPGLRHVGAASFAAVVSGVVLAGTQSYLTSAGSVGGPPFWLCLFCLVASVAGSGGPGAPPGQLDQRERDEREEDAAERHREAGLDVVGGEYRRVDG